MLPLTPLTAEMGEWYNCLDIDLTNPRAVAQLNHFCHFKLPATKQLLPHLLDLVKLYHTCDDKLSVWYYGLLRTIQSHFMTEGNCLFFGDAKEILSGEKDYDVEEMHSVMADKLKNIALH
jgi:hypothetical protein